MRIVLSFSGMAEQLTQMVFCQICDSNMLKHINLLNQKFLMFLYSHHHSMNFCSLMFFSSCCFCVILWFESQNAWIFNTV